MSNQDQLIAQYLAEANDIFKKKVAFPDIPFDELIMQQGHSQFYHYFPSVVNYITGDRNMSPEVKATFIPMYKEKAFADYLYFLKKENKLTNIDAYRCTVDFFTSQCLYVRYLFKEGGIDVESTKFKLQLKKMRKEMVQMYNKLTTAKDILNNNDMNETARKKKLLENLFNDIKSHHIKS